MKSNSDDRPAIITDLGNGSYHYSYNMTQRTDQREDGTEKTSWDCNQVHIWGRPTRAALVKAVIRDEIDETAEFDLVNSYNAAVAGLLPENEAEEAKTRYITYLRRVQEIKLQIAADLTAAGYND